MEKKIYVPTEDELYTMQEMGANVYKYLIVKAIESLTLEGIKYPHKEILQTAYKYLRENPDISYPICIMYPRELRYSYVARNDVNLCHQIINNSKDMSIYNLDNLAYFENGVTSNFTVSESVIQTLAEKLPSTPQYRFEYQSSCTLGDGSVNQNNLLDNIFAVKYDVNKSSFNSDYIMSFLGKIEPAYELKFGRGYNDLITAINHYASRYGLSSSVGVEYEGKDILTKPNEDVKRLIRCINQNRDNIY